MLAGRVLGHFMVQKGVGFEGDCTASQMLYGMRPCVGVVVKTGEAGEAPKRETNREIKNSDGHGTRRRDDVHCGGVWQPP
jgi:hypothetical protein